MKATILDTETGKTVTHDGIRSHEWAENNWSCDCNREILFDIDSDPENLGVCLGCKRFLVTAAEFDFESIENFDYKYTLRELNSGYPEELLSKHGL